jgi:DNA primase
MSRYYPDEFKAALKERADIVSVISQFVQLRPLGNNMVGCCPFHDDKNPSMQVKPATNTFYCHSCGAGSRNHSKVQSSDVYGFLKGILNCNLGEAVEWLANFLGEPLPALDPEENKRMILRNKWVEYCENAAHRFTQNLLNHREAINYLYNRGFTMQDILNWKLGFGDKQDYDFRNTNERIVFSLFDYNGNLVSFTGRVLMPDHVLKETNEKLKAEGKPPIVKYLDRYPIDKKDPYYSSHPYPEFDKRNHLYGIHIAKDYIRQWGSTVIVEGWTDVIKMHKYGAPHTVGSMGVALTEDQVKMLKRAGAKKALLMRDGDEAGYNACLRDAKILEKYEILPMIVPLEPGIDPCDLCDQFVRTNEDLNRYIDRNAMTLNQFLLKKLYHDTQEEIVYHQSRIASMQNERMQKAIQILSSIEDPIEKDIYIRQVSDMFGISYDAVAYQVGHYQQTGRYAVS